MKSLDQLREQILALARSGRLPLVHGFYAAAAQQLNCKYGFVRRVLLRNGIQIGPKAWTAKEQTQAKQARAKQLRESGLRVSAIAEIMGITHQYADQLLNDLKYHARTELNKAISRKDILRPSRCDECGHKSEVEGHHEDYHRPLAVRWLCFDCHREITVTKLKAA